MPAENRFFRVPGFYSIKWKGPDGIHTSPHLQICGWNDEAAEVRAKAMFGDNLISVVRSDPEAQQAEADANLAAHPSRTPLDEKTGGVPARAVENPDLLKDDE